MPDGARPRRLVSTDAVALIVVVVFSWLKKPGTVGASVPGGCGDVSVVGADGAEEAALDILSALNERGFQNAGF
jgi:hypothetical protein